MVDELGGRLGGLWRLGGNRLLAGIGLVARRLNLLEADILLEDRLVSPCFGLRNRLTGVFVRLLRDLAPGRPERLLLLPLELLLRRAVLALELEMLPNGIVENPHRPELYRGRRGGRPTLPWGSAAGL